MGDKINWDEYKRLQVKLHSRKRLDSSTWGLEVAMSSYLGDQEDSIETASRRERYRSRMLAINRVSSPSVWGRIQARIQLQELVESLGENAMSLLSKVATGYSYNEIAGIGVRSKVCRLRRQASQLNL